MPGDGQVTCLYVYHTRLSTGTERYVFDERGTLVDILVAAYTTANHN